MSSIFSSMEVGNDCKAIAMETKQDVAKKTMQSEDNVKRNLQ